MSDVCDYCGRKLNPQEYRTGLLSGAVICTNANVCRESLRAALAAAQAENQRFRRVFGLKEGDVIIEYAIDSLLVDGAGGSRRRIWPSTEREERLDSECAAWRQATGCSTHDEAARLRPNPCAKIFDHKWLDPVCVEGGCQSLFLKHARERIGVLEAALRDVLQRIENSYKGSIGSIENTYMPQIGVEEVAQWRAALSRPEATIGGGGLVVEPKETEEEKHA